MHPRVTFLCLAATLTLGFAPVPPPKERPKKPELSRLQGRWKVVGFQRAGEPPRIGEGWLTSRITIVGNRLTFLADENQKQSVWHIHLDVNHSPKHCDLTGADNDNAGQRRLAVYLLKDDTLTIVVADQGLSRPTRLRSDKDGFARTVFKRSKR
jgi:uncharacterized protein (TIGR03067 family)